MSDNVIGDLIGQIKLEGLEAAVARINEFAQAMKKLQGDTQAGLGGAEKDVESFGKKTESTFETIEKNAVKLAAQFAAISAAIVLSLNKGMDAQREFEKSTIELTHKIDGSMSEQKAAIRLYGEALLSISVQYAQKSTDLSNALSKIVGVGYKGSDALKVLGAGAEFAAGQFENINTAIDPVLQIMKAYEIEAGKTTMVTDQLSRAADFTKLSAVELGESLRRVANPAHEAGLSLATLLSVMALSERSGLVLRNTVSAVTSAMMAIITPSQEGIAALQELGIQFDASTAAGDGFINLLAQLAEAQKKGVLTGKQLQDIFGDRRAIIGLMPMIQRVTELQMIYNETMNAGGTAAYNYGLAQQSLDHNLRGLEIALSRLAKTLFEPLSETVVTLTSKVALLAQGFALLSPDIRTFMSIAAGVIGILTGLTASVLLLVAALKVAGVTMGIFLGTMGGIVAIAALAGVIAILIPRLQAAADPTIRLKNAIDELNVSVERANKKIGETKDTLKTYDLTVEKIIKLKEEEARLTAAGLPTVVVHQKLAQEFRTLTTIAPQLIAQYDRMNNRYEIQRDRVAAVRKELEDESASELRMMEANIQRQIREAENDKKLILDRIAARQQEIDQTKIQYEQERAYQDALKSGKGVVFGLDVSKFDTGFINEQIDTVQRSIDSTLLRFQKLTAAQEKDMPLIEGLKKLGFQLDLIDEQLANLGINLDKVGKVDVPIADRMKAATEDLNKFIAETLAEANKSLEVYYAELKKAEDAYIKAAVSGDPNAKENAEKVLKERLTAYTTEYQKSLDEMIHMELDYQGTSIANTIAMLNEKLVLEKDNAVAVVEIHKAIADLEKEQLYRQLSITREFNDQIKSDFATLLTDGDYKAFGDKFVSGFKTAFARSLVEKSGFDAIFKGNIADLGNLISNIGTSFTTATSNVANVITTLFGGAGSAATAVQTTTTALMSTADAAVVAAENLSAAAVTAPGMVPALDATAVSAAMAEQGLVGVGEGAKVAETGLTAATGATKAAGLSIGTYAAIAAVAANGIVQGFEDIHKAFSGGVNDLEKVTYATLGVTKVLMPATTGVGMLARAMGIDSGLADGIDAVVAGATIGTMIMPGFGTAVGAAAGALAGFGEELGIISHGVRFEEQFAGEVQAYGEMVASWGDQYKQFYSTVQQASKDYFNDETDLLNQSAEDRREIYARMEQDNLDSINKRIADINRLEGQGQMEPERAEANRRQLEKERDDFTKNLDSQTKYIEKQASERDRLYSDAYLRMTNYATDYYEHESNLLNKSYSDRLAYYNALEKLGMFSPEQMATFRDALQLYDTEAEKSAAAERTRTKVLGDELERATWAAFEGHRHLMDEIGGYAEVFQSSVAEADQTGQDLRAVYENNLREMGTMSEESIQLLLKAYDEATGNLTDSFVTASGGYRDLVDNVAASLKRTGTDMESFSKKVNSVSNMYLAGSIDDIKKELLAIPGMTEQMAGQLTDELKTMKDAGMTSFSLDEAFQDSVKKLLSMDTSKLIEYFQSKGYESGDAYKKGFLGGASGSGILGDVLWDDKVIQEAIDTYAAAGEKSGSVFKEGAARESLGIDLSRGAEMVADKYGKAGKRAGIAFKGNLDLVSSFADSEAQLTEMANRLSDTIKMGDFNLTTTFFERGWGDLNQKLDLLKLKTKDLTTSLFFTETPATESSARPGAAGGASGNAPISSTVYVPSVPASNLPAGGAGGSGGGYQQPILAAAGVPTNRGAGANQVAFRDIILNVDPLLASDKEYWRRLTRDNILPAINDELARTGESI